MTDPTPDTTGQVPVIQPVASQAPATNDAELAEARREAAKYRTELRKLQEAQEATQREAQERQGQYQQLYETEKAKAEGLSSVAERAAALEGLIASLVKDERAGLPEEFRALIPDGPPEHQLDWIVRAKKALPKIAPPAASPPGPRGTGGGIGTAPSEADLIARKKASGGYSL